MESINNSKNYDQPAKNHNESEVVSFKITHGYKSYIYSIHTQDDEVLFSAEYESDFGGYKRKSVDNATVSRNDMKILSNICEKYVLDVNLEGNDKLADSNLAAEIEIIWKNSETFRIVIDVWAINQNKAELMFVAHVLTFFDNITKRFDEFYLGKPSAELHAEGKIILAQFNDKGKNPVHYELRKEYGDYLFDADCFIDIVDENDIIVGSEEIILRDEDVTHEDMEKFEAIFNEYNFIKQQINIASGKKSYYLPPWKDSVFKEFCDEIGFISDEESRPLLSAIWENNARISAYTPPDDMAEALCGFFLSLVKQIKAKPVKCPPEGKIVSIRFSQYTIAKEMRKPEVVLKHTIKNDHECDFYLREENGILLFDGYCLFNDRYNRNSTDTKLKLEKVLASSEDLEALHEIFYDESLVEKWYNYPEVIIEDKQYINSIDGDIKRNKLEVIWENGAKFDARVCNADEFIPAYELRLFFSQLAKRLDKTLSVDGKLISFKLKGEYTAQFASQGRFIPDMRGSIYGESGKTDFLRYEYYMREENGKAQFNAYQSDHPSINNMFSSINNNIPTVENIHLEALRALCKKYDFEGKIQEYHGKRWEDFHESDIFVYDASPNPNYDFFEIEWENGAHCEGMSIHSDFREFFRNIVNIVLPQFNGGQWTCSCGTINNSKFCTECGTAWSKKK